SVKQAKHSFPLHAIVHTFLMRRQLRLVVSIRSPGAPTPGAFAATIVGGLPARTVVQDNGRLCQGSTYEDTGAIDHGLWRSAIDNLDTFPGATRAGTARTGRHGISRQGGNKK